MPTAAAPRRTQLERRTGSEEALLDAAAALVAARGVDRASLASIGENAGLSRGLPTHHFGSKDALIARLAQRAQNEIDQAIRAAVGRADRDPDTSPALELLLIAVDTYLRRFEQPSSDDRALIVMWGATFPADASVEGMVDADQRSVDGWAGLIRDGQTDGSVRQDLVPLTGAALIQGMLRGTAATLLVHNDLPNMARVRTECLRWIEAVLLAENDERA